jgi:hypothetical protein
MEENIFLAEEKHGDAERHFSRMVQAFKKSCEIDHKYGLDYDLKGCDGPITQAYKRIADLNGKIQRYNEGRCLLGEGPCPFVDAVKGAGFPKNLPYIEDGKDYWIFQAIKQDAEAREENRKKRVKESLAWI